MSKKKQLIAIYLFLTAASLMAYWQVIQCDFINFDDPTYVTENIHIRHGITMMAIRWAFTTGYAANWHPLTWMSHMLDVQLFGLNPRWHHLTNLLFHIGNTLLLFFVFHRMTKAPWQSAFVAALFALHPFHVESVAWVAERKDVLSAFFWMLTMAAYIYHVERPSLLRYSAVLVFFIFGLMAKPMLVTLPFVLLLLDYWPLLRLQGAGSGQGIPQSFPFRPLLLEKLPLFALAALSCIVTYIVHREGGAVRSFEAFSPGVRIANAVVCYVIYAGKTIWPNDLAVFYPHPGAWPLWQVMGAVLLFGVITLTVIRTAKRFPYLAFGWLWFAVTLVPVIGIVQVGRQAMADRYTYIPLIGLFVMAAWGVPQLLQKWRPARPRHKEILFASAAAAVFISLFIVTSAQVGCWRDSIALYDHALKVTIDNDVVRNNLGCAYDKGGNYSRSIEQYDRAVEINPQNADAYINRGVVNGKLGNYRQAIPDYDKAIEIEPGSASAFSNRGSAHSALRNYKEAIKDYSRAIEIDPGAARAYNGRAIAYISSRNRSQAIEDFQRAVEIDPDYAEAQFNLGHAYADNGDNRQATGAYGKAIELDRNYVAAYVNRGLAYHALGDYEKAIEDFDKAIEIKPKDWIAYNNRAEAYDKLGNKGQALTDMQKAKRFRGIEAKGHGGSGPMTESRSNRD